MKYFINDAYNLIIVAAQDNPIPIALYENIKSGRAKKGQTILLAAFGTGLSWAATIIKL